MNEAVVTNEVPSGPSTTKTSLNCSMSDPVVDVKNQLINTTAIELSSGSEERSRHVESDIAMLDRYYDSLTNLKELCHTLCNRFPSDRVLAEHKHVLHSLSSNVKLAKANLSMSCLRKKAIMDSTPDDFREKTSRTVASTVVEFPGEDQCGTFPSRSRNNAGQQPMEGLFNVLQNRQSRLDFSNDIGMVQSLLWGSDDVTPADHTYDIVDVTDTLMLPMEDILCNTTDQRIDDDRVPPLSLFITRSQGLQQLTSSVFTTDQSLPENIFTTADDFLVAAERIEMSENRQLCSIDSTTDMLPESSCVLSEVINPEKDEESDQPDCSITTNRVTTFDVMPGETLDCLVVGEELFSLNGVVGNRNFPERICTDKNADRESQISLNTLDENPDSSDKSFIGNCMTAISDHKEVQLDASTNCNHHVRTKLQQVLKTKSRRQPINAEAVVQKSTKSNARKSSCRTSEPTTSKRQRLHTDRSSDLSTPTQSTVWQSAHIVDDDLDFDRVKNCVPEHVKNNFVTLESDLSTSSSPVDSPLYQSLNSVTVEHQPIFINLPYALVNQADDNLFSTEDQQTEEDSHLNIRRAEESCRSPKGVATCTTLYSCAHCNLT